MERFLATRLSRISRCVCVSWWWSTTVSSLWGLFFPTLTVVDLPVLRKPRVTLQFTICHRKYLWTMFFNYSTREIWPHCHSLRRLQRISTCCRRFFYAWRGEEDAWSASKTPLGKSQKSVLSYGGSIKCTGHPLMSPEIRYSSLSSFTRNPLKIFSFHYLGKHIILFFNSL